MEEELYSNSNQLYTNSNLNDEQKRFIELFNVKESGATYDKARGILYVDEFNIKSKDEPYTEDIDDIDELYTEYNDVLSNIVSVKLTNGATIFTDISSFFGSLPAVISDIRNANVVFNTYMEIAIEESGKINNIFFIDNSSKKDCYKSFKFDCLNGIADKIYLPKVFDIDKDIKKEYEIEYFSEFF